MIKKILLEDAIESYNDLDKKELLEKLEDGKLTDDEFNQALTNKGFNLKNYLVQYSQDVNNHHDIVSESWSEMINKAVQSSQGNSIDSIS